MKPPSNYKWGFTSKQSRRGLNVVLRREPVPPVDECEAGPYDWSCEDIRAGAEYDCTIGLWKCPACRWSESDHSVMNHYEAANAGP